MLTAVLKIVATMEELGNPFGYFSFSSFARIILRTSEASPGASTVKCFTPIKPPYRRRILTQKEWNVLAVTLSPKGTREHIRCFISSAALFVKVNSRIFSGSTPFSIIYIVRYANVLVFPLPAPALIAIGPSIVVTASSCWGFNSFL